MTSAHTDDDDIGFLVARADWDTDRQAIRAIRQAVFVQELGIPEALEFDDADADCVHYLAYGMSGNPVATARMQANGQIGRMAVLPEWRGRGVGSALLLSLIELASEHRLKEVFVHAQTEAAGFYHLHGFIAAGDPFEFAGIAHIPMSRFCDEPESSDAVE